MNMLDTFFEETEDAAQRTWSMRRRSLVEMSQEMDWPERPHWIQEDQLGKR